MPSDGVAARCADVVKTYGSESGEVRALRGVTADFDAGALTTVAGPSGSGKSSLLRLLAGMDRPTEGSVVVGGVHLGVARHAALRRLRRSVVGYVFQRPSDNFFPHLTVGEHLRAATRGSGRAKRADEGALIELLGIGGRLHHLPSQLSGGEQQRAALAQVLVAGAGIVIADEPTAELDTTSSIAVLDAIQALVGDGVTFVVATHDPDVIRRASSMVRLDHGRVASSPAVWRSIASRSSRPASDGVKGGTLPQLDPETSPARKAVLEVHDITKSYRRGEDTVHAVRDASLVVMERELVGLLGRSGSGKTTLLNIVAGWERPDTGHVIVSERAAGSEHFSHPWSEVAVVPQKLGLMEELTIRENVEYPARLGGSLPGVTLLIDELLESLGLRDLQDRFPVETSLGEQQRAAMARALVLSPRLVLADEPTGHQDAEWAKSVLDTLRRAVNRGTGCLTASHGEEFVRYLDRVLSMSDGLLVERTA